MKQLGMTFLLASVCLLGACGSEIKKVHNETYHNALVLTDSTEEQYMEKPINESQEQVTETLTTENSMVALENKEDTNNVVREELLKRAEVNKEEANASKESTKSAEKSTTEQTKKQSTVQVKEKVTSSNKNSHTNWQATIKKISKENIDGHAKIRKLTTLNEQYTNLATAKDVKQFKQTLMNDFITGEFTNAIGQDQAMLTYIFKTYIVSQKTSKQKDYSLFMFMTTFHKFLEDIYLVPNTITEDDLDKRIDKLYQIFSTIE